MARLDDVGDEPLEEAVGETIAGRANREEHELSVLWPERGEHLRAGGATQSHRAHVVKWNKSERDSPLRRKCRQAVQKRTRADARPSGLALAPRPLPRQRRPPKRLATSITFPPASRPPLRFRSAAVHQPEARRCQDLRSKRGPPSPSRTDGGALRAEQGGSVHLAVARHEPKPGWH